MKIPFERFRVYKIGALVALTLALLAASRPGARADGNNWMAGIDGGRSLTEMSIPGAHDAGARFEPLKGTTKCQNLTISELLNVGVRFLDIRCCNTGKEFSIYHGPVFQRLTFAQALTAVSDFLKTNPTETVIMSIKEENSNTGSTFKTVFNSYVAKDPKLWYLKSSLPTLNSVRSKIVLFRRFTGSQGIDASNWPDNTSFTSGKLDVEDYYHVPNSSAKWEAVVKHLDAAKAGSKQSLYITFASGYVAGASGLPNITAVSDDVNQKLSGYFQNGGKARYGVVLIDFVDLAICRQIATSEGG